MPLLLTVLIGTALAQTFPGDPLFDDLFVYPPDVLPEEPVLGGELRVDGGGALVLEHSEVIAEVHAGLARVTLIQWFANPYDEPLEATYLFPLPETAAVFRMDLVAGDRLIEGVVMERDAARDAYEEARRDGRRAALLEQERDNLFTQSVSGLCPGEVVEVTLEYVQEVRHEDGLYELVFPTTMGERFSPPWVEDASRVVTEYERSGRDIDITVYIDEGLPLETVFSDTHVIEVLDEGPWGATVALSAEDRIPNRDFSLTWSLAGTEPRASVLAHRPDPTEPGYVAVTLEPQILGDLFEARPRELLFVIDSSGSMEGQPYETARRAVLLALERMGPGDTFDLVRFSDASSALFDRPQPSTPLTRRRAREWLDVFDGGGTMMEEGIVHSFTLPGDPEAMRLVLMLTDGFVSNEGELFGTVRRHLGDARLFSLGIGSSTNRYLLEGLAEMGRGDVSYQLPDTPLEETVEGFYARIAHPAMSDIHIDWGDLEVTGQYPQQIPDLWSGQPLRVVARYTGAGTGFVRVDGIVGREPFALRLPVTLPEKDLHHEGVAKLWARRRIRDIEWYPRGRTPAQVKAEVTGVALSHHLVSRYTSLVAIDEEPSPCGPITLSFRVPLEVAQGTTGAGGIHTSGFGCGGGGGSGYGVGYGKLGTRGSGRGSLAYRGGTVGSVGGDPIILGAMDRSLIAEVVERNLNPIRYCYERELQKDPTLEGRIVVQFLISADGRVATASIRSTTLGSPAVESCVVGRFLRMRFPASDQGGIVIVTYPFAFHPKADE